MGRISVDLNEAPAVDNQVAKIHKMAAALPSVSKAKASAIKDAPRVQFSFTNVPKPIKDAFVSEAKKRGITQKEYLYACLRAGGVDVPADEDIDGRRR